MKSFTIKEINKLLNGELIGYTDHLINGPEQLAKAEENHITFIGNKKYLSDWPKSKACAAIINDTLELDPGDNRALIRVKNADLSMALLLEAFDPGSNCRPSSRGSSSGDADRRQQDHCTGCCGQTGY